MKPRMVSTARGDVEVAEIGGPGPTVLVVHGISGDWRQARTLAADLAADFHVLLPSRPGYGRTPLTTGRTAAEQGDAHAALLDALGISGAAVVGVSGGGPSARTFASQHPERCPALVLCCAVASHLVEIPTATRLLAGVPGAWQASARIGVRRQARLLADVTSARASILAELPARERAAVAEDERVIEDVLAFHADRLVGLAYVTGLRNDYRDFRRSRAAGPIPWPKDVRVPTLVLHGDADSVVDIAHGRYHAETIPGATLEVQEGAGHGFGLTLRRATNERIRRFLLDLDTS